MNFTINHIFLIEPRFTRSKSQDKNFIYLENKQRFPGEIKKNFITYKGLSVAKICFRPERASLIFELASQSLKKFRKYILCIICA